MVYCHKDEDDLLDTERGCPRPIYTLPITGYIAYIILQYIELPLIE